MRKELTDRLSPSDKEWQARFHEVWAPLQAVTGDSEA